MVHFCFKQILKKNRCQYQTSTNYKSKFCFGNFKIQEKEELYELECMTGTNYVRLTSTVVKHVSKEGDDVLVHLKDEAFQSLKNFLKQESKSNETTIKSTIDGEKVSTSSFNNDSKNEVEFLNEIKTQVINAIKNTLKNEPVAVEVDESLVNSILEHSSGLIKNGTVHNMSELEANLNNKFPEQELFIQKIINSTTGFLTAKGTEAGTMLSSILANLTNSSIQGELKETEKTTVKVTRTITEKIVNSKGETKIITRKVTDTIQNPRNMAPE